MPASGHIDLTRDTFLQVGEGLQRDKLNQLPTLTGRVGEGSITSRELGDLVAYDTVAELTADSAITKISTGDRVVLCGYYAAGDFGQPIVLVVEAASAGVLSHALNDGRYANLYADGRLNVKWFGATGDGSTDDTTAIGATITAASAGDVIWIPEGTFMTTGVDVSKSLTFDGTGTVKQASSTTQTAFAVKNAASRVRFQNLKFDGNKANRAAAEQGSTKVMLSAESVSVTLEAFDCTFINNVPQAIASNGNLHVERCRFTDIAAHDGTDDTGYIYALPVGTAARETFVVVRNCYFEGVYQDGANEGSNPAGVFISGGDTAASEYQMVDVSHNHFVACGGDRNGNAAGAIDTYNGASQVTICNNVIQRYSYAAIKGQALGNAVISGNICKDGVVSAYSGTAILTGIIASEKPRTMTTERNNIIISNNEVLSGSYIGIEVKADDAIITGNIVREIALDSLGSGIYAQTSSRVNISDNHIWDCEGVCIDIRSCDEAVVMGNTITQDGYTGQFIYFTGSDRSIIANNKLRYIGGATAAIGMRTDGPNTDVQICGNQIESVTTGLDLRDSGGNLTDFLISGNYFKSVTTGIGMASASGTTTGFLITGNKYKSVSGQYVATNGNNYTGIDVEDVHEAYVTIPTASVLALNSTPYTLIAAPGNGAAIIVDDILWRIAYNTTQYAGANNLEFRYNNGSGDKVSGDLLAAYLNTSTTRSYRMAPPSAGPRVIQNQAVVAYVPTANPTAGDSDVFVRITYRVKPQHV